MIGNTATDPLKFAAIAVLRSFQAEVGNIVIDLIDEAEINQVCKQKSNALEGMKYEQSNQMPCSRNLSRRNHRRPSGRLAAHAL